MSLILTDSLDPWHNLALEELLFDTHTRGVCLYLWRNQNTVVIGRNQNAWKECRLAPLEQDGGKLARRTSGGGAVFHDTGNLNFTFITTKPLYDQTRQLALIVRAVRSLGIAAQFTGRNDIVTQDGAKFSGNAFRHSAHADMHHGTLLVDVDMDRLSRYLAPSKEKLRAKGVESVRARVRNLHELSARVTIPALRQALIDAFFEEYGAFTTLEEADLPQARLAQLTARHASWEWRCGASPRFDAELSRRFPWGELQLQFCLEHGHVAQLYAYSDAMDEAYIRALPQAFAGVRFAPEALRAAVPPGGTAADIAAWLGEAEV